MNIILFLTPVIIVIIGFAIRCTATQKMQKTLYNKGENPNPPELEEVRFILDPVKKAKKIIHLRKSIDYKTGRLYEIGSWVHIFGVVSILITVIIEIIIS